MTPDLMRAGAEARRHAEQRAALAGAGSSGGRVASYGRIVRPGQLDVAHGAILYLDDITVSFDGFKALNALSMSIRAGELRCIIGPNGAGKTTMMDVITGKTRPDAGHCFFGSTIDLLRMRENEIASAGIGRKFQKPTVFEHLSVFENLELALKADRGVRASLFFRLSGAQLDKIGEMLVLIHLKDHATGAISTRGSHGGLNYTRTTGRTKPRLPHARRSMSSFWGPPRDGQLKIGPLANSGQPPR